MNKFVFILPTLLFVACNTNDQPSAVDNYINQVKSETYTDIYLPDLEPSDISALLSYRNDKQILTNSPSNPISSYRGNNVTAGMVALWTIESIRVSELNGDTNKYNRFPSLNPMVTDTTNGMDANGILQDSVAQCYFDWWNNNSIVLAAKLLQNPLSEKRYKWY